jgi:transcriptional regulator of acetoin/glycerol metabolism
MTRKQKWNWQEALVGRARTNRKPFPTLAEIEAEHIGKVVQAYGENLAHAALALGVSRSTLYRKLDGQEAPRAVAVARKRRSARA